jgi:hypothetical protein
MEGCRKTLGRAVGGLQSGVYNRRLPDLELELYSLDWAHSLGVLSSSLITCSLCDSCVMARPFNVNSQRAKPANIQKEGVKKRPAANQKKEFKKRPAKSIQKKQAEGTIWISDQCGLI